MKLVAYQFLFSFFLLLLGGNIFGQTKKIAGIITEENGDPLIGVTIIQLNNKQESFKGTISDFEGRYKLENVMSGDTLQFSYTGYLDQKVVFQNQLEINITLLVASHELNEVVVIGYGSQKKKDLTGATGIINTKEVELQAIQRTENILQGKVAGVTVSQNSGAPGAAPKVNIRGFTGEPVYVIDGFIGGDINSINPNDIENISVLKDASATAIYGSRGANGVILITTKSGGKKDKLNIDFGYYHTVSLLANKLDLLDPSSYMQVANFKAQEGGASALFSDAEINEAATMGLGTDWQDAVFRTAHSNNYQLSIAKGGEKNAYRLSIGARQDEGIITNSDYERYTLRFGMNSNFTNTTKFVLNISGNYEESHNTFQGDRADGANDVVAAATAWSPNLPIFDPTTGDYQGFVGYGATVRRNPVFLAEERNRFNKNYTVLGNISLEQAFLEDFKIKIYGGAQVINGLSNTFLRFAPATLNAVSSTVTADRINTRFQGNIQLNYEKELTADHRINALLVYEALRRENQRFGFTASDPITDQLGIYSPNVSETFSEGVATLEPERMLSYLSRVGYSFKDKLLLNGSLRVDGSSRLPAGNKYQTFLSGAIAYRLSEEPFLRNIKALESMKVRLSYGETGNVNSLTAFQIQDLVKNFNGYTFTQNQLEQATGFEDGNNRANADLIWETSRQFSTGIDISLWRGAVSFTGDYYLKFTENSLFDDPEPAYLGGGASVSNAGKFRNNGIELQLITKWLNRSDFSFTTSFNFTYNQSEVIKLPQDSLRVGNQGSGFDAPSHILITGQPVGQMVGYTYLGPKLEGVSTPGALESISVGEAQYLDRNGDGVINLNDMTVIGNGHPDFTWGVNTNIKYKRFSLNVFIQGVHGLDVYNIPQHGLLGGGSGVLDATSKEILNSWSLDRVNGNLPSLNAQYEQQSSLFLENGSFIRLNNLTLAYDLPNTILERLRIRNLRIYGSVQNLATFTKYSGYDPEVTSGGNLTPGIDNGAFPIPRSFTFGINLGI